MRNACPFYFLVQYSMETEYIKTKDTLIKRNFNYEKPHKYGTEFSSGQSTIPSLDTKYVRIENKEAFLQDYQIPTSDILNFVALKSDGSIKMFKPDDFANLTQKLEIPDVRVYTTGFTPDYSTIDLYYVPQNIFTYDQWRRDNNLPQLHFPIYVNPFGYAIKVKNGQIVSHKRYGFSTMKNPFDDIGKYLITGNYVHPGGQPY